MGGLRWRCSLDIKVFIIEHNDIIIIVGSITPIPFDFRRLTIYFNSIQLVKLKR